MRATLSLAKGGPLPAPRPPYGLASALTLSAVALVSKAFMALCRVEVRGRENLDAAIRRHEADNGGRGRGAVTVCNHNSVVDDPFLWSILPTSTYLPLARPRYTCWNNRWTLGASDIMFTNPLLSRFFTWGQVIETVRGAGIYQPAVDQAIGLLEAGGWVHIFPEGRVNQPKQNPGGGMFRFKWGVSRMLMDSTLMPEVIPMWISGFDSIMHEYRRQPRFLPRPFKKVTITIGPSLTPRISPLLQAHRSETHASRSLDALASAGEKAALAQRVQDAVDARGRGEDPDREMRIRLTEMLQAGVRELGEGVEEAEGRFAEGRWSQSRSLEEIARMSAEGRV